MHWQRAPLRAQAGPRSAYLQMDDRYRPAHPIASHQPGRRRYSVAAPSAPEELAEARDESICAEGSPADLRREIFGDQLLIIRTECFDVRAPGALRVQIVRTEFAHPVEHLFVVIVHQVLICAF